MKQARFVAILLAAFCVFTSAPAFSAEETIGVVKNSTGKVFVTRVDQVLPAAAGMKLLAGDILNTGSDGSLGVILRDDSTLSLGPGTSLAIRNFLFSPSDGKLGMLIRISRGTMAYLSGLIGKLAPESVRFETPVASIGIRGTRFAMKVDE